MKRVLVLIFISVVCCQCSQQSAKIIYEGAISTDKTEQLTSVVLNESFLFSAPCDLMILDSVVIVRDSYLQADCFHVFRKSDGAFVKSFGQKGRGPGECSDINAANTNYDNGLITVYDPNYKKIILFDIVHVLNDIKPYFKEYAVSKAPNVITQILPYKNDFIVKGNDDKLRYGFWSPSSQLFHPIYTDYPQLSNDSEDNWALTDYAAKVRLSPDGKRLAAATYIGGVLEIFDIDDNGFNLRTARFFFEPKYDYVQGAMPRWITTSPKSILGFQDLFLTNEAIYGLVWGVECAEIERSKPQLIRFDFDGNPITSYDLDEVLDCVAVDDDGVIYGVGCDSEGQHKLSKYIPTCK